MKAKALTLASIAFVFACGFYFAKGQQVVALLALNLWLIISAEAEKALEKAK